MALESLNNLNIKNITPDQERPGFRDFFNPSLEITSDVWDRLLRLSPPDPELFGKNVVGDNRLKLGVMNANALRDNISPIRWEQEVSGLRRERAEEGDDVTLYRNLSYVVGLVMAYPERRDELPISGGDYWSIVNFPTTPDSRLVNSGFARILYPSVPPHVDANTALNMAEEMMTMDDSPRSLEISAFTRIGFCSELKKFKPVKLTRDDFELFQEKVEKKEWGQVLKLAFCASVLSAEKVEVDDRGVHLTFPNRVEFTRGESLPEIRKF